MTWPRGTRRAEPSAKSTMQWPPPFGRPHASALAPPVLFRQSASAATRDEKLPRRGWQPGAPVLASEQPYLHSACVARHLRDPRSALAGTAAFVVTEELKLEPDPIARPRITPTFSPTCRCETQTAQISFRLRQFDRRPSRSWTRSQVVPPASTPVGRGNHTFGWDGRNDSARSFAGLPPAHRARETRPCDRVPAATESTRRPLSRDHAVDAAGHLTRR
jgi:hypothetical protein